MKNRILVKHRQNWGLDEKVVEKLAGKALGFWGYSKNVELSVYFVGRKKAKDLNIRYRQMDYVPQVLGFPMNKTESEDGYIRLGDVVICGEKLKYEARYYKKKINQVLEEWLVHGVENLLK